MELAEKAEQHMGMSSTSSARSNSPQTVEIAMGLAGKVQYAPSPGEAEKEVTEVSWMKVVIMQQALFAVEAELEEAKTGGLPGGTAPHSAAQQ